MEFNFEHQVLIGTILGGASLVKPAAGRNYHLSMRSHNLLWLEYKMALMPNFFPETVIHQYGVTFRCNSTCSETLTRLHDVMYCGEKRTVSMEILDSLRDIALAIWFLDRGGKGGRGRKNAYINTTKFGEIGTITIRDYFHLIDCYCQVNCSGSRRKVLFSLAGTEKFFRTVAHHFPKFMWAKMCL